MTIWEKIYKVLFKPSELFDYIENKPSILFPLVVLIVSMPLFFLIRYDDYLAFVGKMLNTTDPEEIRQMGVMGLIFRPAGLVVTWLVSSALMLGFTKIVKGEGTFKHFLSVNGYAYFTHLPMLLIMTAAGFFTGELLINFSPAIFIPHMKGTFLYAFLRIFCMFFLWQHILMIVGFCKISKTGIGKSILIVLIIFAIEFGVNFQQLKFV
ncbi:MAG: hypothetical protein GY757_07110 [bacterium]|nr:hypothetical protein [bacterium]